MLDKIIELSIRNKLIIGLLMVGLIGFGIYEATKLPIDAVPDITDNQVQVITIAPALGAPDVERLISFPIEQANSNIPGLKKIRSFSRFGLSVVTIVFEDKTDIYWARQQVLERLQEVQTQLPTGFGVPKLAPVTTGLGEIYQYSVRPKKGYEDRYSPMELRTIQDWIVRRQLLGVKGVAEVSSFGGYLKQYEISLSPEKLKSYGISINDVFTALESNNENTGGAYIEKGPTALFIRSEGLVGKEEDIRRITVKTLSNGAPLLVRDVADVRIGYATRYGAMTYNGKQEVSGAVVMMLKGANSSEVINNIKERVKQIQKTLPEGVVIDAFLDRTKMVDNAISTVKQNLIEGALIVVFVLVLFLGNLRAGILVASVIPLSMLIAVILMNAFGVSGNLMSLGALDFGLIVDGTLIIVEACMFQLHHSGKLRLTQPEMDQLVHDTSTRMRSSAVFGELIILIVYLPIFTLAGVEGKMFKPMAQTVAFALFGAFVLSLTYVPTMSALLLSKKVPQKPILSDRIMDRLSERYRRLLDRVLHYPKMVIMMAVVLLAAAVFVISRLGGEFIPQLEEGDYAVETRVLPGSSLTTSRGAVSQASRILLQKFPEVQEVVAKTGSSEVPTDPMPIDASDMMVILKDKKHWTSATSFNELTEKMTKELEVIPGVTFGFQYPVQMRFNELMTGARQDVVCKIYGEDLDTLAMLAKRLGAIASGVNGARDLYVESVTGMPQIVIRYDRAAMAQYGLSVSAVNKVVNAAFAGQSSGMVYEGERRFDMVVRLTPEQRTDVRDVQQVLIATPTGSQVPLSQVAQVGVEEGPNQIQREDAQRRIIVGFNVRGRDVQSLIEELQQKAGQGIKMPAGYFVTYGGAFENLMAAKKRLSIAVPVALLLIFIMLYFAFHSVRESLLIFSAIPLSAIGGVFALALRGMPFSISAGIGFIALFGVAVLNGIVLIAEFNRMIKEGMTDTWDIILKGTKTRMRPVLMTASVASLGFLPMALSNGAGAEVQRPLATVVIGGLVVATLLTLFVLPCLYLLFEGKKSKEARRLHPAMVLLPLLLCASMYGQAQERVSLKAAIDTAVKNNAALRSDRLNEAYRNALRRSAVEIPRTQLVFDYGQINSVYNDNKIGLSQSVKFPTVYARQGVVLDQFWKESSLTTAVRVNELKKQVALAYAQLVYIGRKGQLLREIDSLYASFLQKAELRFKVGETDILERTAASTQRGQIAQQLLQVASDSAVSQVRLQWLMNATQPVSVDTMSISSIGSDIMADSNLLAEHPYLRLLQQQQATSSAELKLERSKLLPDLLLGYNNMSIRGVGADEKTYPGSKRFQSVQAGIGIPIFTSAERARIQAARIRQRITENNMIAGQQQLNNQLNAAVLEFQRAAQALAYYKDHALPDADTLIKAVTARYEKGEITYLEWVVLANQAVTIRSEYIEVLNRYNLSIIEINSITDKL